MGGPKNVEGDNLSNASNPLAKKLFAGLGAQSNGSGKDSKAVNPFAKVLAKTTLVKDIRIAKEKAKQRRSELVYGTNDMKTKLFERE